MPSFDIDWSEEASREKYDEDGMRVDDDGADSAPQFRTDGPNPSPCVVCGEMVDYGLVCTTDEGETTQCGIKVATELKEKHEKIYQCEVCKKPFLWSVNMDYEKSTCTRECAKALRHWSSWLDPVWTGEGEIGNDDHCALCRAEGPNCDGSPDYGGPAHDGGDAA